MKGGGFVKKAFVYFIIILLVAVIAMGCGSTTSTTKNELSDATKKYFENVDANKKNNTTANNAEFDAFYQEFKKWHNLQNENMSRLQFLLDGTAKGNFKSVDFYDYLKSMSGLYLEGWSYWNKKSIPSGLNGKQGQDAKQIIEFTALSILSNKEAYQALMDGLDNPGSVNAQVDLTKISKKR